MNLDTLDSGELYAEICGLARTQGTSSQADWDGLCDETLDSHANLGELNDDEDLEGMRTELHAMWEQYRAESGEESPDTISEDPDTI